MEAKILEVGDKVKWSSQSNASRKMKVGSVHVVVEAGQNAMTLLPTGLYGSQIKFDSWYAKHKRYIVAVPRGGKSDKNDYYCPRVGDLQTNTD
jgi:hypothetical protein